MTAPAEISTDHTLPPRAARTLELPRTITTMLAPPPAPRPKTAATTASTSLARPTKPAGQPLTGWARLRECESHGDYTANTGNGYYGAYQFSAKTWHSLGLAGLPHQASPADQDAAARRLLARSGWRQWPNCGRYVR